MLNVKTAIFLGAGASKPMGYPLTNEMFPRILQELAPKGQLKKQTLFTGINDQAVEFKGATELYSLIQRIFPGCTHRVAGDNLPWITDVLSLVDYTIGEGKVLYPGQTMEELRRVRWLFERAIYECLWRDEDDWTKKQEKLVSRFGQWLRDLAGDGCGIISSNYDTLVDSELFKGKKDRIADHFDFGFSWLDAGNGTRILRSRPANPWMRLYKLHGSLNWLRCSCCEHVFVNPYGDIVHNAFDEKLRDINTCHCGDKARLQMHIVAPSSYRTIRDPNLLEVWKSALDLLIRASEWIIIGYSFPPEDLVIRSMFLRAFHSRNKPPRIRVIQPNDGAKSRYQLLFPDCEYENGGLEGMLNRMT